MLIFVINCSITDIVHLCVALLSERSSGFGSTRCSLAAHLFLRQVALGRDNLYNFFTTATSALRPE